jgi:hypothetical protein
MTKSIEQLLDETETLYVRMPTKHQQFLTLMLSLAVRDLTEAIYADGLPDREQPEGYDCSAGFCGGLSHPQSLTLLEIINACTTRAIGQLHETDWCAVIAKLSGQKALEPQDLMTVQYQGKQYTIMRDR